MAQHELTSYRTRLLGSVAFLAGAMVAAPVSAQDASSDGTEVAEREVIVVTGERARNRATIAQKEAIPSIYDSINVDEIGQLPDFNVPDAFRRVPGVSAIFDEDEGRFVTARGLPTSYNYVTFDGASVATIGGFGDGSRNVNLEAIPSTAVKRLEVFKTYTPDQDLGWIGGYFNLVTRSAFDNDGFFATATGELNYYTFDDVPSVADIGKDKESNVGGRAEFAISNVFGDLDQFGFVVSGTYKRKSRDEEKVIQDNYRFIGADNNGDGVNDIAIPERFRWYVYNNLQERYGLQGKFEWRPSAVTSLSWNNYVYAQQEDEMRYGHQIRDIDAVDIVDNGDGTGTFSNAFGEINVDFFPLDRRYGGSVLETSHEFGNGGVLNADLGWTFAEYADGPFPSVFLRTPRVLSGSYDLSGGLIGNVQLDPASVAVWLDDANYTDVVVNELRTRESWTTNWTAKLNYDFNTGGDGFGYKVGMEYRDNDWKRNNTRQRFDTGPDSPPAPGFTIQTDYTPPGRDVGFLFLDYDQFTQNATFILDAAETFNRNAQDDFNYNEEILAFFGMLTYGGPNYEIIGGLRYEDTTTGGRFFSRVENGAQDIFVENTQDGGYDFLAPSISGVYRVNDELRFKAAFSQTLGRPNPDQVSRSGQSISFDEDGNLQSATLGNPDLKPRQSNNYDVGVEYYFDDGDSLASLGVFYKDITDEIVTATTTRDVVLNGQTFTAEVRQPVNAETAQVFGVEAQVIKNSFDFLPAPWDGLGFSGNVTWTDAEIDLNETTTVDFLQFQSEWLGNAALFYNWNDRAEARIAYSLIGEYNDTVTSNEASRRGWQDFATWDFSARYDFNDNWRVKFDARNLTDENRVRVRGPGLGLLHEDVEFGRSFFLGVTYKH